MTTIAEAIEQAGQAINQDQPVLARSLCDLVLQNIDHPQARYFRGLAFLMLGDFRSAVTDLDIATHSLPNVPEIRSHLAQATMSLANQMAEEGQIAQAESLLHDIETSGAEIAYLAAFNQGLHLQNDGRLHDAESAFRRALDLNPDYASAGTSLGRAIWSQGRLSEAADIFRQWTARLRAQDMSISDLHDAHESQKLIDDLNWTRCTPAKLEHDLEQWDYLVDEGIWTANQAAPHRAAVRSVLDEIPPVANHRNPIISLNEDQSKRLAACYKRQLHVTPAPRLSGPAINPSLDHQAITKSYISGDPKWATIDNLLTCEALFSLRRYCLETSMWNDTDYQNGYVGAKITDGFDAPLLIQIGEELRAAFPGIIGDEPLMTLWAYKYDNRINGIATHGDDAKINFNFWITPDEALTDLDGGGMKIYTKAAPKDWSFDEFNGQKNKAREYLTVHQSKDIIVPYRQNRAVVFQSDLFHETGKLTFKNGYQNRRISITYLFGRR